MYEHTQAQTDAIIVLFSRYKGIAQYHAGALSNLPERCRAEGLQALCGEAIEKSGKYPFDKLNRWLGFVQGVLAAIGAIDVDQEREFSRPLLHSFHLEAPPTFAS